MAKRNFSKTIYVSWEKPEHGDPWMEVHLDPSEVSEVFTDVEVGVYKLERVAKVKTTAELV